MAMSHAIIGMERREGGGYSCKSNIMDVPQTTSEGQWCAAFLRKSAQSVRNVPADVLWYFVNLCENVALWSSIKSVLLVGVGQVEVKILHWMEVLKWLHHNGSVVLVMINVSYADLTKGLF